MKTSILHGMARALWVTSYAEYADENPDDESIERAGAGEDWEEIAPETPSAADRAARELAKLFEQSNGGAYMDVLFARAVAAAAAKNQRVNDKKWSFGFAMAMQALGHGVSWFDDYPEFPVTFPMFECHYDGEELRWSGRPREESTRKRNPDAFDVPGVTNSSPKVGFIGWDAKGNALYGPDVRVQVSDAYSLAPMRGYGSILAAFNQRGQVIGWVVIEDTGHKTVKEWAKATGWKESNPCEPNPANVFTAKGERMYEDVKAGYKGDPRAAEIAARTVYARAHEGVPGLLRNGVPNCGK